MELVPFPRKLKQIDEMAKVILPLRVSERIVEQIEVVPMSKNMEKPRS